MRKTFRESRKSINRSSGQIVVEYILLLLIAVSSAMVLTKGLVGRRENVEDSGVLIKTWHTIIQSIGNDLPDCPKQKDFKTANCP